jgi:hypothetical protein
MNANNSLADALAGMADTAQGWIKQQSGAQKIPQEEAHELSSSLDEVRLIAGSLDSAAVSGLSSVQPAVLTAIGHAKDAVANIRTVEQMIDLAADLFELASAIGGGKSGQVLASLQDIDRNVKEISGS